MSPPPLPPRPPPWTTSMLAAPRALPPPWETHPLLRRRRQRWKAAKYLDPSPPPIVDNDRRYIRGAMTGSTEDSDRPYIYKRCMVQVKVDRCYNGQRLLQCSDAMGLMRRRPSAASWRKQQRLGGVFFITIYSISSVPEDNC